MWNQSTSLLRDSYRRRAAVAVIAVVGLVLAGVGLVVGRILGAQLLAFGALLIVMVEVIYSGNTFVYRILKRDSSINRAGQVLGYAIFGGLALFVLVNGLVLLLRG